MDILIIGGTRNLGHFLTHELLETGHRVTVVNRGKTRDELPEDVERLRADRTVPAQLEKALAGRSFDVVVDTALYNGADAETTVNLLSGRVGHYIFISTGQIYLVREGLERPFSEDDYKGRVMPAPKPNTFGYEEWLYGIEKRQVEDTLANAWQARQFPFTSVRIPMVNSERDHFHRLYGYILRLSDGGSILVPETPDYALRHVYVQDVVQAISLLVNSGKGKGRAYNISQDETVSLTEFLGMLGEIIGIEPQIMTVRRSLLEANGFLPDCSPFSERWMSELTNERSKVELGMEYTPLRTYLGKLVAYYETNPPPKPASYRRRHAEMNFVVEE
jgi:nucleoside-diphosphate-sugar epimerase